VTSGEPPSTNGEALASGGYRISVDGGRDSFFALQIEDPDEAEAWLLSGTVRSLEEMR
jgi:hypothetical protein